jgi:hypothetical protein
MKRVRSSSDLEAFAEIPKDVLECVLMRVKFRDWKTLSLVCKKFYEVTRRKRCIQRWFWKYNYAILKMSWFPDIRAIAVSDYHQLHGLCVESVKLRNVREIPSDFVWPSSVKQIAFNDYFWNYPLHPLPAKLEKLYVKGIEFNHTLEQLPSTLRVLQVHSSHIGNVNMLPDTIEHLFILNGGSKITKFPAQLKSLSIRSIDNVGVKLPDSLDWLKIRDAQQQIHRRVNLTNTKRFKFLQIGNIIIKQ